MSITGFRSFSTSGRDAKAWTSTKLWPRYTDNSPSIVQTGHHAGLLAWKGPHVPISTCEGSRVCNISLITLANIVFNVVSCCLL